jgi:tetratricopeptide (TPR) repeat protein
VRKIFEQLKATLAQFIKQRDYLLLLIVCQDSEAALVLKALRDLDRESASNMFLLFADEFRSADSFVDDVAARLDAEHNLVNESGQTEALKLPPLPAELLDRSRHPHDRFEAGLCWGRSLIDPAIGQRAVWGVGPLQITDESAYYSFLAGFLPNAHVLPWMRGARIIARVPAHFQLHSSPFAGAQRVQVQPFSIPPGIQEQDMLATAADPKLPPEDRMQAEVQLGYLDYGYGRFDAAIERFMKALAFYQWAEIPAMEGLVICGLGDVARALGNWNDARYWYECAVVPAGKARNPMLLSTVIQDLAVVSFVENRFGDAEERYSELVTLKRAMVDEIGLVEALEWQGLSQEKQNAYDRAVVCWEEGALICRSFELKDRERELLGHLRRGYEALGMREELATFDAEWSAQD